MEIDKWLPKLQTGDKEAFQYFYEAYAASAIRTAAAITKNRELAKDAVQETFIRVYRNMSRYNPDFPFDPWFYRILTNECLRLLKKEAPLSTVKYPENNSTISVESFDQLSVLYDTIQSLDDIHRIPLILKYVQGFTEIEIANILSVNQNTLKSRLFKGRKRLKEILDAVDKEDEAR